MATSFDVVYIMNYLSESGEKLEVFIKSSPVIKPDAEKKRLQEIRMDIPFDDKHVISQAFKLSNAEFNNLIEKIFRYIQRDIMRQRFTYYDAPKFYEKDLFTKILSALIQYSKYCIDITRVSQMMISNSRYFSIRYRDDGRIEGRNKTSIYPVGVIIHNMILDHIEYSPPTKPSD